MNEQFVGTMPVQDKHRFDPVRLESYLRERIDGFAGPLAVEQFKGGQSNPTFRLGAGGEHLRAAAQATGQAVALGARCRARVPRADARYATATCRFRGPTACVRTRRSSARAFFVMDCVAGRVLWDPSLQALDEAARQAVYEDMNRVIAALHRVDYRAVGLADFGKPGNYFARQIARWTKQYRASETERIEAMDRLIAWLPENIPAADETAHRSRRLSPR